MLPLKTVDDVRKYQQTLREMNCGWGEQDFSQALRVATDAKDAELLQSLTTSNRELLSSYLCYQKGKRIPKLVAQLKDAELIAIMKDRVDYAKSCAKKYPDEEFSNNYDVRLHYVLRAEVEKRVLSVRKVHYELAKSICKGEFTGERAEDAVYRDYFRDVIKKQQPPRGPTPVTALDL